MIFPNLRLLTLPFSITIWGLNTLTIVGMFSADGANVNDVFD